jgi:hypothetical protein
MLEKGFEKILCKYPELIEEGLKLKGNQVLVSRKFVDILFEDQNGQDLIIELKKGTVVRKDIAQILDYAGHFIFPEKSPVRVMLIGNYVPKNLKTSLDYYGIEYKEIPILDIKEFLQSRKDLVLLSTIEEADQDINVNLKHSKINRIDSRQIPIKRRPQITDATTFKDLCDIIRILSNTVPTNYMDLLLLENEDKPLSEILSQWQNYEGKNRDFTEIRRIKTHINWRENHDGWIFDRSGTVTDPVVKLIGLKGQS